MDTLVTIWWAWIAFALLLGVVELLAPGFIFLGFALGAVIMAAVVGLIGPALTTPMFLALFAGLSLLAWIGLRVAFRRQTSSARHILHDIND